MYKWYVFNGLYGVLALNKSDAYQKLKPKLRPEHQWYLKVGAENPNDQGHLTVQVFEMQNCVAFLDKPGEV